MYKTEKKDARTTTVPGLHKKQGRARMSKRTSKVLVSPVEQPRLFVLDLVVEELVLVPRHSVRNTRVSEQAAAPPYEQVVGLVP